VKSDLCEDCIKILDDYASASIDETTNMTDIYLRLRLIQKEFAALSNQMERPCIKELIK